MTVLVVDGCSHAAARHAVMTWHYSRTMPSGKLVSLGAWEDGRFVGAVIFGRGATPKLGSPYGLHQGEVCELVRVALDVHETPTSQVVASAIRWLHRENPGLRLIVSFADVGQGHIGTLYQAGNWLYLGSVEKAYYRVLGEHVHPRTLHARYGIGGQSIPWLHEHIDPEACEVPMPPKHRYVMPLDRAMRRRLARIALPFPRGSGLDGELSGDQLEGPGSTPGNRSTEEVH